LISKEYVINNPTGLHARPASRLVETAKKFKSSITLECDGKKLNAKSVLKIMGGGLSGGKTVNVVCEGEDEEELMAAVADLFENNFYEGTENTATGES